MRMFIYEHVVCKLFGQIGSKVYQKCYKAIPPLQLSPISLHFIHKIMDIYRKQQSALIHNQITSRLHSIQLLEF